MKVHAGAAQHPHPPRARKTSTAASRRFRLAPIARAMALAMLAGGMAGQEAYAQRPLSGAWFAAKGASQQARA
ncbi:hypothetical protein GG851_26790, partial [Bordetella petrii]|nr:hypothetical protein [Bordetella petrii]